MTDSTSGSIHALSGAYVVDALDDAERAAFEQHLAGCHDCQAEVAGLREAATLLADDAATTPPASLRANVLAGIRTIRPLPPETGGPEADATTPEEAAEPTATVLPMRRRFRLGTLAVAAAILAIFGIAAVAQPWQQDEGISVADQVMTADDATHVKVNFDDGSTATVFRSAEEGKAVVVTENMAKAPPGKVYELWLQKPGGDMVPAGLMRGEGDQKQVLEGDAAKATAAAISVEPSGGSDAPTSDPVATFDFADT